MSTGPTDAQELIRSNVARLMDAYGPDYWKGLEEHEAYPEAFVKEFEGLGFGGLLVPQEYGGPGGTLSDAVRVLEEIHARGGNAQPFHGQYYLSFLVSRFAAPDLRKKVLGPLAKGELRMQSFALTEAEAGSDTARIRTTARPRGDGYVVSGRKMFVSRVEQSDLMVLVARTAPLDEVAGRTKGLSLFLLDLREAKGIERTRVRTMFNSQTYEVFFNDVEIPGDARIGEEGRGFEYLLHVLNPERMLIASECLGDARWFIDRATEYAKHRVVFGKPIGSYQGVQFPIAEAYAELVAADLVRWEAVRRYEADADSRDVGKYANLAKYLASQCSWHAGNVAMDVHGGYGMTRDMHIERKLRETRLYQVAPVANNLVLGYVAHSVLGLPKSY
ncbi:MAG TPA: acyl-CoA dehydrogenase family protein [Thermoplasmata archaeon]|nr:acyl-CoA dehydrogenase family protein [Thermoplasmata archaeon]